MVHDSDDDPTITRWGDAAGAQLWMVSDRFFTFWTLQERVGGILEPIQSLRKRSGAALEARISISEGLETLGGHLTAPF